MYNRRAIPKSEHCAIRSLLSTPASRIPRRRLTRDSPTAKITLCRIRNANLNAIRKRISKETLIYIRAGRPGSNVAYLLSTDSV